MEVNMRATRRIKMIMADKAINIKELAEKTGKGAPALYQTFYNDEKSKGSGMSFEKVAELADALGCDIVFRDRETGKIY